MDGETGTDAGRGPQWWRGAGIAVVASATTALGIGLASRDETAAWAIGQAVLGTALVQWFSLIHECGHGTLTGVRWFDRTVGVVAAFFTLIPFEPWCRIHALHHRWTGWQDVDPTTTSLAPRARSRAFLAFVDVVWWSGFPLVAILYRFENYWNLPRLLRRFDTGRASLVVSVLSVLVAWSTVLALVGPLELLVRAGPALLLALLVEDQVILSQHTHVPQRVSGGATVKPIPAPEQARHTRSLAVPGWVSRLVLFGLEAHELHHAHPAVPGYRLRELGQGGVAWWRFVLGSRTLRGSRFLYENRDTTGVLV